MTDRRRTVVAALAVAWFVTSGNASARGGRPATPVLACIRPVAAFGPVATCGRLRYGAFVFRGFYERSDYGLPMAASPWIRVVVGKRHRT